MGDRIKQLASELAYRERHRAEICSRAKTPANRAKHRIYEKTYRERHLEERRARGRIYAAAHREENSARVKAWRALNPIKAKKLHKTKTDHAKQKIYRAKNRDKLKARWQAFYIAHRKAHPDRVRAKYRAQSGKRRALKAGSAAEKIDCARVISLANGVCGICHKPFDLFGIHIDHIVPLARGGTHTYENVQATHARCNLAKGARTEYRADMGATHRRLA